MKSLVLSDSNTEQHESSHISSSSSKKPEKPSLKHHESTLSTSSDDSSWDVVEELPLRWATDYIPLASPGSRLLNLSVLFFELMKKGAGSSQNTTSLAIATRQSILLYETPKGERAFRFAKVRQNVKKVTLQEIDNVLGILYPSRTQELELRPPSLY